MRIREARAPGWTVKIFSTLRAWARSTTEMPGHAWPRWTSSYVGRSAFQRRGSAPTRVADAARRADSGGRSNPRGNESLRQVRDEAIVQPAVTPDGDRSKEGRRRERHAIRELTLVRDEGNLQARQVFALIAVQGRRGPNVCAAATRPRTREHRKLPSPPSPPGRLDSQIDDHHLRARVSPSSIGATGRRRQHRDCGGGGCRGSPPCSGSQRFPPP